MTITLIIFVASFFIAYAILSQPGELLGFYPKLIWKSNLSDFYKKMFTCPYCIAGRWSLYLTLYLLYIGNAELTDLMAVPVVIILVYTFSKKVING